MSAALMSVQGPLCGTECDLLRVYSCLLWRTLRTFKFRANKLHISRGQSVDPSE